MNPPEIPGVLSTSDIGRFCSLKGPKGSLKAALLSFTQLKHPIGVTPDNAYISGVRSVLKILVSVSTAAVLGLSAQAVAPDASIKQYQNISDRNVFGLRPPPVQPTATNATPALSKITLTGITTILGNKRALMKVAPKGMKPGDPKELSMILTEGQREGEIEVLQIDETRGSVKVNNSGTEILLTFEKDGSKLPASPGPQPVPPPMPTPLPAAAGVRNPYTPATRPALPGLPTRTARIPGAGGLTGAAAAPIGGAPTPTGATSTPAQSTLADQDLTAEEQAIIVELQRQANANNPSFPAPAPASGTQTGGQGAETATPGPAANPAVPARPPVLVPQ